MTCFNPVPAWKVKDGEKLVFSVSQAILLHGKGYNMQEAFIQVACRKCIGCRVRRAQDWTIRARHELHSFAGVGCFLTLTYNDESLAESCSNVKGMFEGLNHRDFQLFIKRLRKAIGCRVSYLMVGEYGELFNRPHFHVCLFGYSFNDLIPFKKTKSGKVIYRSVLLEKLWKNGYSSVGELNDKSINYVARYTTKKSFVTTTVKKQDVGGSSVRLIKKKVIENGISVDVSSRIQEYVLASRNPALGRTWLEKYWEDIYNFDVVKFGKYDLRPPEYYDSILKGINLKRYELIKDKRAGKLKELLILNPDEYSKERLRVKEQLVILRNQKYTREMEEEKFLLGVKKYA